MSYGYVNIQWVLWVPWCSFKPGEEEGVLITPFATCWQVVSPVSCMNTGVLAAAERWPFSGHPALLLKAEGLFGAWEINADLTTMSRNRTLSV